MSIEEKWKKFEKHIKVPEVAGRWLNLIYTDDLVITKDFIYPDTNTKLRPGIGKKGVKMPGGPQYIVIHDTGMPAITDDAKGLNKYIHDQANSPDGRVASWHFSIDDKDLFQHVPTDEIAWHAGDGSRKYGEKAYNFKTEKYDIGGGNHNGIGIETCINPTNDYELTLKRTAKLVAMLLYKYNLELDRIKQHYDFSSKNCPNIIRSTKGLWESFLEDCRIQYILMPLGVKVKWEIDKPDIIKPSGKVITPIHDTYVNIKAHVTIDNETRTYEYKTLVKGISDEEKIIKSFYELYLSVIPKRANHDINLPSELTTYKTKLKWKSSHPNIISDAGKYNKPEKPTWIKLTAIIESGEIASEKEFTIKIF